MQFQVLAHFAVGLARVGAQLETGDGSACFAGSRVEVEDQGAQHQQVEAGLAGGFVRVLAIPVQRRHQLLAQLPRRSAPQQLFEQVVGLGADRVSTQVAQQCAAQAVKQAWVAIGQAVIGGGENAVALFAEQSHRRVGRGAQQPMIVAELGAAGQVHLQGLQGVLGFVDAGRWGKIMLLQQLLEGEGAADGGRDNGGMVRRAGVRCGVQRHAGRVDHVVVGRGLDQAFQALGHDVAVMVLGQPLLVLHQGEIGVGQVADRQRGQRRRLA